MLKAQILIFVVAIAVGCPSSNVRSADPEVFSGPQVGESLAPLEVLEVYNEGNRVDLIKRMDGKPLLLVFVHKLTRPGVAVTRALTNYGASLSKKGVGAAIVWLDDDQVKASEYLTRAKGSLSFRVPVGVSVDGKEGPGAYGLNRNVELTVLVAKDNKVTANFALIQPSVSEAAKMATALADLVQQPAPTQQELEKLAYGNRSMMAATGDLRPKMRKLIDAGDEKSLKEATNAINQWVGKDARRKAALARMSKAVLDRGLGSEQAKEALKKWSEATPPANARPSRGEQEKDAGNRDADS